MKVLGTIPVDFTRYWLERFPLLLIHVWGFTQCLRNELNLSDYYHKEFIFPTWNNERKCDICAKESNNTKEPIKIVFLTKPETHTNLQTDNFNTNYKMERESRYMKPNNNKLKNKSVHNGSPKKRKMPNRNKYEDMNKSCIWTLPIETSK